MRRIKILFIFLCSAYTFPCAAQLSADTLSVEQFILWVDSYHPLMKAVNAKLPIAKAELLKRRGQFDPVLAGNLSNKTYENENYYNLPSWSLSTATAGPVRIDLDWNATAGLYTNPQDKLPEEGLFAIGGMLELGNGLFTDERRTALRLAKAGVHLGAAEAELDRNELLFRASKDYWKWFEAQQNSLAYFSALQAAKEIQNMTRQAFIAGDASGMDTLDANGLVSTWEAAYFSARQKSIQALFTMSNWLWSEAGQPIVLAENVLASRSLPQRTNMSMQLTDGHPLFQYNNAKERQFELKENLAKEYLKPKLGVGGAFLLPGNFETIPTASDFNERNRIVKAKVAVPLLLREGRGYSKSQSQQTEQFKWERDAQENAWTNQLNATAQSLLLLEKALDANQRNAQNMEALLHAEREKLRMGDSELLKVNLRTSYFAKALIQQAEAQSQLGIKWAEWLQLSAGF